jgi:hypothetical protein
MPAATGNYCLKISWMTPMGVEKKSVQSAQSAAVQPAALALVY